MPSATTRPGMGTELPNVLAMHPYEKRFEFTDQDSGLYAVTIIHSTVRGPAFGGIRRYTYASALELNQDVERLASAMTLKCAAANLPAGGAKTAVWDRHGFRRKAGYTALGRMLSKLNGQYISGPDIGTNDDLLQLIRAQTPFVNPPNTRPGESTARGVLAGIRGVLRFLDNNESFDGKRYGIEGLGAVGLRIAADLVRQGGEVIGWDIDPSARRRAEDQGVKVFPAYDAREGCPDCDVFVPCALGNRLNSTNLAKLRCRAICGAANNQLETPKIAQALKSRNIAYVPDFVVNVGAVIEGVWTVRKGDSSDTRALINEGILGIANTCETVLQSASDKGISTHDAALQLAISRL